MEATYALPNLHNLARYYAFKTLARELYAHSNVEGLIDRDFTVLLTQEDLYAGQCRGFVLSCMDGLFLLSVYEYTRMEFIVVLTVVNPKNIDR